MRVPRIYTASDLAVETELTLEKNASHHLITVLRAKIGAQVVLFNGDGFDYRATIVEAGKYTRVQIQERQDNNSESTLDTGFLIASLRGDRMDYAIQKSVELGVNHLIIFHAMLSSGKPLGERQSRKLEHWQAVIQSAAEQSGRSHITSIDYAENFARALALSNVEIPGASLRLLLDPTAKRSLSDELKQQAASASLPRALLMATGPESGFSDEELARAGEAHFTSASLGQRVLRAETAPVCALAVAQATLGDLA